MLHGVPALRVPSTRGSESPQANVAADLDLFNGATLLEGAVDSVEWAKGASDAARTKATSPDGVWRACGCMAISTILEPDQASEFRNDQ
jgi:hypothetical protein